MVTSKRKQATQELMLGVGLFLLGVGLVAVYFFVDYPQKGIPVGVLPIVLGVGGISAGIRSFYHYVLVRQEEKNKPIT